MSHEGYHEPSDKLSDATKDMHRAIISLMEELEAIDWYNQRIDAATDSDLKDALRHNATDEKEHVAMLLEWIRRRDPALDAEIRDWLFTDKPLRKDESGGDGPSSGGDNEPSPRRAGLTVGSVRGPR